MLSEETNKRVLNNHVRPISKEDISQHHDIFKGHKFTPSTVYMITLFTTDLKEFFVVTSNDENEKRSFLLCNDSFLGCL